MFLLSHGSICTREYFSTVGAAFRAAKKMYGDECFVTYSRHFRRFRVIYPGNSFVGVGYIERV